MMNTVIDFWVWSFLQYYYAPFFVMGKGTELEQWVSSFSTNGFKSFNICKPN